MTEHKKTNREQRMTPRKAKAYRDVCDKAMLSPGQKCPLCKNVCGGVKRLKKEKV